MSRGLFFEVTMGGLIRDASIRRNIIANVRDLIRVMGGPAKAAKHLIFTSGMGEEGSTMDMRAPDDVANL